MTWLPPLVQRAKVEVYAKAEGFEPVELLSDGFESAEDPPFFNKGFQMLEDRKADFLLPLKLEALIIPSPNGEHRTTDQTLPMFHQDCDRVGLRRRRQYDSRRTFISLSQADGARKDILRWVTHGATGDIVDLYTTLPWAALCAEVEKLRIELREDRVLEFRQLASGACDSPCDSRSESNEKPPRKFARGLSNSELRGLDLNQRPSGYEPETAARSSQTLEGKAAESEVVEQSRPGPSWSSDEPTVTLSHELIGEALAAAHASWLQGGDVEALRRALLDLLRQLEDGSKHHPGV